MARMTFVLLTSLVLAACAAAPPPATTPGAEETYASATSSAPTPTEPPATTVADATRSSRPTPTLAPISPFDGTWASEPLSRDAMTAALTKAGLDATHLDDWFGDWDKFKFRTMSMDIRGGRWIEGESADDEWMGNGWAGDFRLVDDHTIVGTDDEFRCDVTYKLERHDDDLTV